MNPTTELSNQQLERYARHLVLRDVGGAGQAKLLGSHVTVIGAGGIGSPALLYLAAAGVGRLTIVDDDIVALSNLQRQILFDHRDIGAEKANAAAVRLHALNRDIGLRPIVERIDEGNVDRLLADADLVLDGSDNFATRLAVADAANRARIPLVSAAIGQFHGQIGTFMGWSPDKPCYRCFVGDAHDPDECDNCSEVGVLGAMVGIMGSWAAMEVIRVITGFGEDQAGRLHIFDGLKPEMRTIRLPKDPACPTCGAT